MKRKWMMAALLSAALMAAGCAGDNTKSTESAAQTEADITAATENETEGTAVSQKDRPDYKALEYVTLGEYKGLPVTLASTVVTEDEIDSQIARELSAGDNMETLTEGTVENGDVANIDFEGIKDGVAFEGGTRKGYDLTIGSGSFIEGFEDGLVGKKVGETVDLDLTFPEDYGSAELAGQAVVFHVTINSIKRVPELTDELAAKLTDSECKTVEEYRAKVESSLQEEKASSRDSQKVNDLLTQIYNNSTINDYPMELVEFVKQQYVEYYAQYAEQSDMTLDEFLQQNMGTTEEAFMTEMEESAKQGLRQEMLLKAIVETEALTLEIGEYEERAQRYVEQMGFADIAEMEEQYGIQLLKTNLLLDKALELVEEHAVVTDPDIPDTETETEEK